MGTYLGGSLTDWARDVAVDAFGNTFVVGYTNSTDFPITPGGFNPIDDLECSEVTFICGDDGFLVGIDPSGRIAFSTLLGGSSRDGVSSVAVDSSGNAYVAGSTSSDDFPTTDGAYDTTPGGGQDAFVMKFNPAGDLLYSTLLGGEGSDWGRSISVDSSGHAYVAGLTHSLDFPISEGVFVSRGGPVGCDDDWPGQTIMGCHDDVFVVKLNPSGAALDYSTAIGGSSFDGASVHLEIDTVGSAYVTGWTTSADFPVTPGAFDTDLDDFNSQDTFVFKLGPQASTLEYATFLGGSRVERPNAIAVDPSGKAYVVGYTYSPDFPTTPGAIQTSLAGPEPLDSFLTVFDPSGSALTYSTLLGGGEGYQGLAEDFANGVYADGTGMVYVTGNTESRDFPTTPGAYDRTHNGASDAFVAKLNLEDGTLNYSTFLGGGDDVPYFDGAALPNYCVPCGDSGLSVVIDETGNATVVGVTTSLDFPATEGAPDVRYNGGASDAFVVRIELIPEPNRAPVAYFEVQPSQHEDGRIFVNASNSADAEDADGLLEVRWDWEDDGKWDVGWSTVKEVAFAYACSSAATIRLAVRDTEGLTNETTREVDVGGGPPACPMPGAEDGLSSPSMIHVAAGAIVGRAAAAPGRLRHRTLRC